MCQRLRLASAAVDLPFFLGATAVSNRTFSTAVFVDKTIFLFLSIDWTELDSPRAVTWNREKDEWQVLDHLNVRMQDLYSHLKQEAPNVSIILIIILANNFNYFNQRSVFFFVCLDVCPFILFRILVER